MQLLIGVWLVSAHWGKQEVWNKGFFIGTFATFVASATLYILVSHLYIHRLRHEVFHAKRAEALEMYADWIAIRKSQRLPPERPHADASIVDVIGIPIGETESVHS